MPGDPKECRQHALRRAEFFGGAAAAWPLGVRAQQPALPVVGFLTSLGRNGVIS
jgi:hypothetical protein